MKKAILYVRVRTDEENARKSGWAEQEDLLRRYCTDNNIEAVKVYRENHSAATFDRPEFSKLRQYLKDNPAGINLILCTSSEKFSRNFAQCLVVTEELRQIGIKVQAVEKGADCFEPMKKRVRRKPSYTGLQAPF